MNGGLGHLCSPPQAGEINEMTLPSRHIIRNLSPGGLRPSTLPSDTEVPHNIEYLRVSGEESFYLFEICIPELGSNQRFPSKQL